VAMPVAEVRAGEPIPLPQARALAVLLQTLGDPVRLRILTALDTVCVPVTAIVEATGLRQPTVSHHLRILRDRGLVRGERRGGYVYYCLSIGGLAAALDALAPLMPAADGAR
jgi:DNA-binding transcriptional ArsR family regulator